MFLFKTLAQILVCDVLTPCPLSSYPGVAYKAQVHNKPVYDDAHSEGGKKENLKYV